MAGVASVSDGAERRNPGREAEVTAETGGDREQRGRGEQKWKWEPSSAQRLCLFAFIRLFSPQMERFAPMLPKRRADYSKVHLHVPWMIHVFFFFFVKARSTPCKSWIYQVKWGTASSSTFSFMNKHVFFCIWIIYIYIQEYFCSCISGKNLFQTGNRAAAAAATPGRVELILQVDETTICPANRGDRTVFLDMYVLCVCTTHSGGWKKWLASCTCDVMHRSKNQSLVSKDRLFQCSGEWPTVEGRSYGNWTCNTTRVQQLQEFSFHILSN